MSIQLGFFKQYEDPHIFLTGGTGFFGRSILHYLIQCDELGADVPKISVLSRDPDYFLKQWPYFKSVTWLYFEKGDILIPNSLPNSDVFTHVIHAAGDSTDINHLSGLDRFAQIVSGTNNMLDWASKSNCKRFLFTSSGGVYGSMPIHLDAFHEDWCGIPNPLKVESSYGIAKRAAEQLCTLYQKDTSLEVVVARCFSFLGSDLPLNAHFAVGNFIREALVAEYIHVKGDGTPLRTYMDQEDLARWLLKLLVDAPSGEVYNVGSDEVVSIKELAILVKNILSPEKEIKVLGQSEINSDRNKYVPDITKARNHLNLDLNFSLAESVQRMAKSILLNC